MSEVESGGKWWLRYVVVPLIGGGGIIAIIFGAISLFKNPKTPPPAEKDLADVLQYSKALVEALKQPGVDQLLATVNEQQTEIEQLRKDVYNITKPVALTAQQRPAIVSKEGNNQVWKRLDSNEQRGFYQTQRQESRVAPDGVKFMFGIRSDDHRGWISVFVRQGDDLPVRYSVREEPNSGIPGDVESKLIEKLQSQEVIPIGWTYQSESFIYATAELSPPDTIAASPKR